MEPGQGGAKPLPGVDEWHDADVPGAQGPAVGLRELARELPGEQPALVSSGRASPALSIFRSRCPIIDRSVPHGMEWIVLGGESNRAHFEPYHA